MRLYKKIATQDFINSSTTTEVLFIEDRWIMAQRGKWSISVATGVLETSHDNSETFIYSLNFDGADKIDMAHILKNGNILLTTNKNKVYLTDIWLSNIVEKTVFEADGITPYEIHTPQNLSYPGRYFYQNRYPAPTDETDVYCFGNYCSVNYGAAPVNIYYTADFGETVKIAYKFGVHSYYKDNGTAQGGSSGTPLGDPANPIITRHIHSVEYNEDNGKWYCFTGDHDPNHATTDEWEIHWMEGAYDVVNDVWNWQEIDFGFQIPMTSHLMGLEMCFKNGYIYYSTDANHLPNPSTNDVNGVYRAPITTLNDPSTHIKILDYPENQDYGTNFKLDKKTGFILITVASITRLDDKSSELGIAANYGLTPVEFENFTGNNFNKCNTPNEKGYFRLDTIKFATNQGRTLFVKVGDNLFENP